MQGDVIVEVDGRSVTLACVGDELWCDNGTPSISKIVLRRHNGLYQADYGAGTAAWHDTPQAAVEAAMRDASGRLARLNRMSDFDTEAA